MKGKFVTTAVLIVIIALSLNSSVEAKNSTLHNQDRNITFSLGPSSVKDANVKMLWSLSYYWRWDDSFAYGLGLNYLSAKYTKTGEVQGDAGHWNTTTYKTAVESKINLFSPQLNLRTNFNLPNKSFQLIFKGNLGFDFLFASENNYLENFSDNRTYIDWFSWGLSVGIQQPIGKFSFLTAELGYHNGNPTRKEGQQIGLPIRTEFNTSGIYLQVGLTLFYKARR